MPKQLPEILSQKIVAQSRLFKVEGLRLQFSNGVERDYERLKGAGTGAVMMIAMPDPEHIYLIREYASGFHDYVLTFPKGALNKNEDMQEAANRELQEEIGYGAKRFDFLMETSLSPSYMRGKMSVFLARDLYPNKLEGDEPEPLELIKYKIGDYKNILSQPDFHEARAIAALYHLREFLAAESASSPC